MLKVEKMFVLLPCKLRIVCHKQCWANNDKPTIICLKLFKSNQELNDLIKTMPKVNNLTRYQSTWGGDNLELVCFANKATESSSILEWYNFDQQIDKHCEKLYNNNIICKKQIPIDIARMAIMLQILEKMDDDDAYMQQLRWFYSEHIFDHINEIEYNHNKHNTWNPSIRQMFIIIKIFCHCFYANKGHRWSIAYFPSDPKSIITVSQCETMHQLFTSNDHGYGYYGTKLTVNSVNENNKFLEVFCANYNVLATLQAKLLHLMTKYENFKRWKDCKKTKIYDIVTPIHKQTILMEHNYFVQSMHIFMDTTQGYSLARTSNLAVACVSNFLLDTLRGIDFDNNNFGFNVKNGVSRLVLRQLRVSAYVLMTNDPSKFPENDTIKWTTEKKRICEANYCFIIGVTTLIHLDFENLTNELNDLDDLNSKALKFETTLKRIVIPYFCRFEKLNDCNYEIHGDYLVNIPEIECFYHSCIQVYQLLNDDEKCREYHKKYNVFCKNVCGIILDEYSAPERFMLRKQVETNVDSFLIWKRNRFVKRAPTTPLVNFFMDTLNVNVSETSKTGQGCEKYLAWKNIILMKECCVCYKKIVQLRLCKRCKKAHYCSKKCQKIDWNKNNHKSNCI